jgi:DNA polymerase-4
VENTYARDLASVEECLAELPALIEQLHRRLQRLDKDYLIQKQFVKIKFHDFVQTTVEMLAASTCADNYKSLCEQGFRRGNKPVRLLGVGVRVLPQADEPEADTVDQLALELEMDAMESNTTEQHKP